MKSKTAFSYSIMRDSHMFYFLQSVSKVRELVATGLYRLDGDHLQELASKQTVKLDPYVAEKLREFVLAQQDQNQEHHDTVLQSEKFKAFEEERERLKKMRQGTGESRVRRQEVDKIKGLKEFLARQGK